MDQSKELKEALKGLFVLLALIVPELKDGAQLTDAADILAKVKANPDIMAKLTEAYKGINQVPAEMKEIKAVDILSIIQDVAPEFINLLHALKK